MFELRKSVFYIIYLVSEEKTRLKRVQTSNMSKPQKHIVW
jgi:hypothetical protein